ARPVLDQGAREVAADGEALGGEPDRRADELGEREPAEPLPRGEEAGNDGRRSDRSSAVDRLRQVPGEAEPLRVETVRGPRVEVDAERRPGRRRIREKAAVAAEAAIGGIDDTERERGRDGRVDGRAPGGERA